jgi:hypothetical protein
MKRARRAETDAVRRAVAYIRESTEVQGRGYSPDGQRQAIARYAQDHGFELIDEYISTSRPVGKLTSVPRRSMPAATPPGSRPARRGPGSLTLASGTSGISAPPAAPS